MCRKRTTSGCSVQGLRFVEHLLSKIATEFSRCSKIDRSPNQDAELPLHSRQAKKADPRVGLELD